MNDRTQSSQFLEFAKKIALNAGSILEEYRNSFVVKKVKDELSLDIATSADYAAEKHIIDAIRFTYPTHGILAEESGVSRPNADYVWIIDPLDGTKEYIRNSPYYYTLLSLEHKGKPICAVGYQPSIRRMFYGSIKSKAHVNDKEIHLSNQSTLDKSFIHIGIPNKAALSHNEVTLYLHAINDLIYSAYRLRNTQWDAEGLFNVAMGTVEAYVLPPSNSTSLIGRPKWWDISAGLQIVEIVGGKITDFYGDPIQFHDISRGIVASNGLIHEKILNLLKKYYLYPHK